MRSFTAVCYSFSSFISKNIHHRDPPLFKPPSLPMKPSLLHNSQTQNLLDIYPSLTTYIKIYSLAFQPFDCRNIRNLERHLRCAFSYEDANGHSPDPIGNIWVVENRGWSVYVGIDAGRWGTPKLSLFFRINKGDKTAQLSNNSNEYHEFDITWRAGISIDGQKAIEALRVHRVMDYSQSRTPPYHSGIVDSCPE